MNIDIESQFYILLSLKTPEGFVTYGQYFFGNDRAAAYDLFNQLSGNPIITDKSLLHIDLMETEHDLPVKIKTVCCTLDELAINSKHIARTIFRLNNLKDIE